MHSEDDRAFFQQLYIDYELMMFKKALTVLRNEEESLDAVSDACLMLMKRISTLRQLSDMNLRRYIIITVLFQKVFEWLFSSAVFLPQ